MLTLSRTALVRADAGRVEGRFRRDPAGWLPEPLTQRYGRFEMYVLLWQFGVLVECRVGKSWVRGEAVSRRIVVEPAGGPLGWLLPEVDGDLVAVRHPDGGVVLRWRGGWRPPATVSGHLGLGGFFARRMVDGLLEEVAGRLASPSGRPEPGTPEPVPSLPPAERSRRG